MFMSVMRRTVVAALTCSAVLTGAAGPAASGSLQSAELATEVTTLTTTCPSGQVVGNVYAAEGFESGLPYREIGHGWQVQSGGAAQGTSYASSSLSPASEAQDTFLASTVVPGGIPSTGALYLRFAVRGSAGEGVVTVVANEEPVPLTPAPAWSHVTLDVSSVAGRFVGPGGREFYVGFEHVLPATATGSSTFEVDDVRVYSCTTAPNAGVRGDWTGEGTVDLLGTHTDGDLYLYPGKGTGAVSGGTKVGSGWGGFTWQGSPGDVTGDRRTDLVGRRSDGYLYLYPGKGAGAFGSATKIGSSWAAMTALATPGDMTGDGRPELVARRTDGTLHLYSFATTGTLSHVKQIGTSWNGMAWIIGMGDLNGDRRGDVVAAGKDGCLYAYTTTTASTLGAARKVGCGWTAMNWLTSPGDMNKDGYGDLIARNTTDGSLWFYRGRAGGGVYSGTKVGTGWGGMARIL